MRKSKYSIARYYDKIIFSKLYTSIAYRQARRYNLELLALTVLKLFMLSDRRKI